jgi:hypothetical protein
VRLQFSACLKIWFRLFVTIQAFLEGKTIWGKTIKAFRAIVLPLMVLPWFFGFQQYPLNSDGCF